ncbi:flavoprotein-like protein [Ochromonadaceae sp. CCMP2298]|nr:flavoprotein-like protein [Ochromonadaceae sp. CCMP2298]
MSGVTILYASETGNAEEVAYEIASRVAALTGGAAAGAGVGGAGTGVGVGVGVSVGAQVMSVEEFDVLSLPELKKLVFVASTTGDGDPPDSMKTFWSFLLRRGLSATSLSGLGVGVFGLGDSSYEQASAAAGSLLHSSPGTG